MAENKNSFILYCDLIHTVEQMPDDKAGLLFKHILRYVNDKNPVTDDLIIQLTFEPVKQQLKRDLKAWENERIQRSEAGKKGMEKRWNKQSTEIEGNKSITQDNTVITKDNTVINAITKITDTVNVTVTDTVIEKKKRNIFIIPKIEEISSYCLERKNSINPRKFFDHYEARGWMIGKNKMKDWKAAVRTWEGNNFDNTVTDTKEDHMEWLRQQGKTATYKDMERKPQ